MATNKDNDEDELCLKGSLDKADKLEKENSCSESSMTPETDEVSDQLSTPEGLSDKSSRPEGVSGQASRPEVVPGKVRKVPISVTGYKCEFVSQPPSRSDCPICLLVLRDPHQVTCCGKIFCKACIFRTRDREYFCPICKAEELSCYPDKGLQQELFSSRVYCPKRSQSCEWEGELRELDKHLEGEDEDPDNLKGCKFVSVNCSFCSDSFPRGELAQHRSQECTKRPFTCPTCEVYESTYDNVMFTHLGVCKCRPVNCPNQCGQVLEHQHLEQHVSTQCELALVECEFTGCTVKVTTRDLPGHLADNMPTHMSLLASENRKLKTELEQLKESIAADKVIMTHCLTRTPPLYISYPWKKYATWSGVFCCIIDESEWLSEPFYSHYEGYKLRLKIWCTSSRKPVASAVKGVFLAYELLDSEFEVEPNVTLFVQTSVLDQENGSNLVHKNLRTTRESSDSMKLSSIQVVKCIKRENMEVCVERVSILNTV